MNVKIKEQKNKDRSMLKEVSCIGEELRVGKMAGKDSRMSRSASRRSSWRLKSGEPHGIENGRNG